MPGRGSASTLTAVNAVRSVRPDNGAMHVARITIIDFVGGGDGRQCDIGSLLEVGP
jgi:hypothetical protein